MNTQIYVMTHKECAIPDIDGYVRMQVGSAIHKDLGYLRDDIGEDNISDLNAYYAELTGLYCLWRNTPEVDNIGMCHYRRYFINDNKSVMTMQEFQDILSDVDIIVSDAYREEERINSPGYRAVDRVIGDLFPDDKEAWIESCKTAKGTFGNLFVIRKELLNDYCEWLFTILLKAGDYLDYSDFDDYQKKCLAVVAEELLGVYVKSRKLRVEKCRTGLFDEKRETKELKTALNILLKEEKFHEALDMCNKVLTRRPDLLLPDADTSGELRRLYERIKNICMNL